IYNCVPAPALLDRAAAREKLKLPQPPGLVIGYVGAISQRKGLLHLVEAIGLLAKQSPDVRFVFVGGGHAEFVETLRARAAELDVLDRIHFAGEIKDASRLVSAFDVLVHPSLMEGAPRTVIEAMHSGLPVVGTRAGGTAEIIQDGISGILVP